jgi:molecular chaperone GrpE
LPESHNETAEDHLETMQESKKEETDNKANRAEEIEELKSQLESEKEKVASYEKKIQYLLSDFDNLKKRTETDVQNLVNSIIDGIILKFLSIYDDFVRAKEALSKQGAKTEGLDAILKNMDSFLLESGVKPIEALGEIFDPKLHEAISIKEDPSLDENTVTTELRKGYILKDRVIRPSLVEISKKRIKETDKNG